MKKKDKAMIFNIIAVVLLILAIISVLPFKIGNKENILNFYSVCSFSPISSVICAYAAYIILSIKKKRLGN